MRRASSKWVDTQTANQPNTAAAATSFASGDRRDTANTAIFRVAPVGQVPQARGRIGAARDETRKGRVRKDKNLFPRQNQIEWADLGCRRLATRTARDITAMKKTKPSKKTMSKSSKKRERRGETLFLQADGGTDRNTGRQGGSTSAANQFRLVLVFRAFSRSAED